MCGTDHAASVAVSPLGDAEQQAEDGLVAVDACILPVLAGMAQAGTPRALVALVRHRLIPSAAAAAARELHGGIAHCRWRGGAPLPSDLVLPGRAGTARAGGFPYCGAATVNQCAKADRVLPLHWPGTIGRLGVGPPDVVGGRVSCAGAHVARPHRAPTQGDGGRRGRRIGVRLPRVGSERGPGARADGDGGDLQSPAPPSGAPGIGRRKQRVALARRRLGSWARSAGGWLRGRGTVPRPRVPGRRARHGRRRHAFERAHRVLSLSRACGASAPEDRLMVHYPEVPAQASSVQLVRFGWL